MVSQPGADVVCCLAHCCCTSAALNVQLSPTCGESAAFENEGEERRRGRR